MDAYQNEDPAVRQQNLDKELDKYQQTNDMEQDE